MKKILLIFLTIITILLCVSCGEEKTDASKSSKTTKLSSEAETKAYKKEITIEDVEEAKPAPKNDFLSFEYDKGEAYISSYDGKDEVVNVPSVLNKLKVVSLSEYSFKEKDSMRAVKLPDTLKIIEANTFFQCHNLEIFISGNKVESIGENAFFYCTKLKNVKLNEGLKELGDYVFYGCSSLEEIYIPESVKEIGINIFFNGNKNLTIKGKSGSYAEKYAKEEKIKFEAV